MVINWVLIISVLLIFSIACFISAMLVALLFSINVFRARSNKKMLWLTLAGGLLITILFTTIRFHNHQTEHKKPSLSVQPG
ncbi:MAG: hypothetical protein GC171_10610 [Terrimonas sp.]|nr:hypothetical protein [Terrimonas sp.]